MEKRQAAADQPPDEDEDNWRLTVWSILNKTTFLDISGFAVWYHQVETSKRMFIVKFDVSNIFFPDYFKCTKQIKQAPT